MSSQKDIPEVTPDDRAARDILSAPVEPAPPHRRPLWKKVLRLALFLVLLVVAASFVYDLTVWSSAANVFDKAKKAGIPLTFADPFFVTWSAPDPSPETNGAVSFENAFAALIEKPAEGIVDRVPYAGVADLPEDPREKLSPEMLAAMTEYVQVNTEALDLLHKGAQSPECYFKIDWVGYMTDFSHLRQARAAARLLAVKAALDAEEGRTADAVSTIADGLALARGVATEPALIAGLVGVAINQIMTKAATDFLLSHADPSNEDLAALQKAFTSAAESLSFRQCYLGEIAQQGDMYQRMMSGQLPSAQMLSTGSGWQKPKVCMRPLAWLVRGYFRANHAHSLELMLEAVEAAGNPTSAVLGASYWDKWTARATDRRYVFASMTLPALTRALQQCEAARARLRSAAVCCAALRYRNENGAWPETLGLLVPSCLDAVPRDPFTGGPLVYRIDDKGIMVYSVGVNLVDDRGVPFLVLKPEGVDSRSWSKKGDDAGARVWK